MVMTIHFANQGHHYHIAHVAMYGNTSDFVLLHVHVLVYISHDSNLYGSILDTDLYCPSYLNQL